MAWRMNEWAQTTNEIICRYISGIEWANAIVLFCRYTWLLLLLSRRHKHIRRKPFLPLLEWHRMPYLLLACRILRKSSLNQSRLNKANSNGEQWSETKIKRKRNDTHSKSRATAAFLVCAVKQFSRFCFATRACVCATVFVCHFVSKLRDMHAN